MERISKSRVKSLFAHFLSMTDRKLAANGTDVGGYRLDCNFHYGGWNVEKIVNDGGGVTCPFGERRRNSREMWDALQFALKTHSEM